MALGLGTVAFGLDYGISNRNGRTPIDEAARVLQRAEAAKLRVVDTASLYGQSELTLGHAMPRPHNFLIVTKTPKFGPALASDSVDRLVQAFERSRQLMQVGQVYGLLIHQATDLLCEGSEKLIEAMQSLQDAKLVTRIGMSVYDPATTLQILQRHGTQWLNLIQLPFNVFDQRFLNTEALEKLQEAKAEIHARSPFLQGLLLMDPKNVAPYFDPWASHLERYRAVVAELGLSPLSASLGFSLNTPFVHHTITGACRLSELDELIVAAQGANAHPHLFEALSSFKHTELALIDPQRWPAVR
ncbi:MAG: aldo/keto reductase [Deltaproteobacteria bacterium]|nr:aldo/keto reductase [Deltaproteobacteria bacterium]